MLETECKADGSALEPLIADRDGKLDPRRASSSRVAADAAAYAGDEYVVKIRDKEVRTSLVHTTLSGTKLPKVALPRYADEGEILRWQLLENVPGSFPFTGGVFAFKRENEDPTRMFAGEGDPFRTNRRFHLLADGHAGAAAVHRLRLGDALRLRPRPSGRTSTARSATRACRSPRSTT